MDRVLDVIVAVLVPTVVFLIKDSIQEKKRRKELVEQVDLHQNEELDKLKDGMKAILHDLIIQKCEYHIHNGYITADDIKELEYLNEPYRALGGNGTAKAMLHEAHDLPKEKPRG